MNSAARQLKYILMCAGILASACSSEPSNNQSSSSASSSGTPGGTSSSSSGVGGGSSSSSSGTGGSAGGSPAACGEALFCDDFEAATAGMEPGAPWSVQKSMDGGTALVDTGKAASGKQSVKIVVGAGANYKSVLLGYGDKLPVASNVLYGRMKFFLESAPEKSVHWTFIAGNGPVKTGEQYTASYRYGGQQPVLENGTFKGNQLMANYETPDYYQSPPKGPGSDCYQHDDALSVVPVGEWTCVEWKFDGKTDEMQFWLGETELPGMHLKQTGQGCVNQPADFPWTAPTFEQIAVGWESYQQDDPRTIWIDDVVISEKPIGCK